MDTLYFEDELPYLGTALGVLEAEGVVDTIGLHMMRMSEVGVSVRKKITGRKEKRTSEIHNKCEKSNVTRHTLLPLIDVAGVDAGLEDDLAVAGLCAGDEEGLLGGVIIVAEEGVTLVDPAQVNELVDLLVWAQGCTFASVWQRKICQAKPSPILYVMVSKRGKKDKAHQRTDRTCVQQ